MNWLDILIIIIFVLSIVLGMRIGLIRSAFSAVGIIIGWLLAAQFSSNLADALSDSISSRTIVTVIAYAIIIVLAMVAAAVAARIVKPMLTVLTVGMALLVDKLGGAAVGFLFGILICGALVVMLARLTYNFEIPEDGEGIAGQTVGRIPKAEEVKQGLEDALLGSVIVPIYVKAFNAMPGSTLGLAPSQFRSSIELLDQ